MSSSESFRNSVEGAFGSFDNVPCIVEFIVQLVNNLSLSPSPSPLSHLSPSISQVTYVPTLSSSSEPRRNTSQAPNLYRLDASTSAESSNDSSQLHGTSAIAREFVPVDGYSSKGPFSGSYAGGEWNAQGFFHSCPRKFQERRNFMLKQLVGRDFWFLNELHGDEGMSSVFNEYLQRSGYTGYWSHLSRRRAGVGIIVKNSFLNKFKRRQPQWIHLAKGEVACLRLYGDEGDLDLFSVYFPTGNRAQDPGGLFHLRAQLMDKISNGMRHHTQALCLVGGILILLPRMRTASARPPCSGQDLKTSG